MPGRSKKSSQTAFAGTITRRLPSRRTSTSLTSSGKATSLGSRTAWDRLERNSRVRTIANTWRREWICQVYIQQDFGGLAAPSRLAESGRAQPLNVDRPVGRLDDGMGGLDPFDRQRRLEPPGLRQSARSLHQSARH